MYRLTVMLLVCGLTAVTFQVSAQPGGPPRGGPPGGGRGGPGGRGKPATPQELVARVFASDANKDGKLSKEELHDPRLARLFVRADADSDGVVTKDELTSLFTKELAAGGGGGPGAGPGGPREPGGPGERGGPPGPGGPRVGQIMPRFAQESLNLTDEQKSQLDALQKEVDAKLDKILTAEQKQQLREQRDHGPGGPGGRPGRGPAGRTPQ